MEDKEDLLQDANAATCDNSTNKELINICSLCKEGVIIDNGTIVSLVTKLEKSLVTPVLVDTWNKNLGKIYFKQIKNYFIAPVSEYYNSDDEQFNYFSLSHKRSYNGDKIRHHLTLYLNCFENFYDKDNELIAIYANIKYMMDYEQSYSKQDFLDDLMKYIFLNPSIAYKVQMMNDDNFIKSKSSYRNTINPALQYDDKHVKMMMELCLFTNIIIPLATHFIYVNNIDEANSFILEIIDIILHRYNVDIYNKLFETSYSIVSKSAFREDTGLWNKQDIRGKNATTHALDSVDNILLNLMPRYAYNNNIVFFNLSSIRKTTSLQVVDVGYECDYIPLSSSNRDEDGCSEYDKYESTLTRRSESLLIQTQASSEETMKQIEMKYGPFDPDEIDYYRLRLKMNETGSIVNSFQEMLISNLFYKFFIDPEVAKIINEIDYVKLIIASKKLLLGANLTILPHIISGKVERLATRNSVNKRELLKLEQSENFKKLEKRYKNQNIVKLILSIIGTILCSDFSSINYKNRDPESLPDKTKIPANIPEIVMEEVITYSLLV